MCSFYTTDSSENLMFEGMPHSTMKTLMINFFDIASIGYPGAKVQATVKVRGATRMQGFSRNEEAMRAMGTAAATKKKIIAIERIDGQGYIDLLSPEVATSLRPGLVLRQATKPASSWASPYDEETEVIPG
ncbi:hypothetical protein V1478_002455 [Vespula squamosa]